MREIHPAFGANSYTNSRIASEVMGWIGVIQSQTGGYEGYPPGTTPPGFKPPDNAYTPKTHRSQPVPNYTSDLFCAWQIGVHLKVTSEAKYRAFVDKLFDIEVFSIEPKKCALEICRAALELIE
jgi:hypothetical protein